MVPAAAPPHGISGGRLDFNHIRPQVGKKLAAQNALFVA